MLGRLGQSFRQAVLSAFSCRRPQVHYSQKRYRTKTIALIFHPLVSHVCYQLRRATFSNEGGCYPVRLALANESFKYNANAILR